MPSPVKLLKISPGEPKSCGRPSKNILEKQTQPNILSQPKKKLKINTTVADINNLKVDNLEVI